MGKIEKSHSPVSAISDEELNGVREEIENLLLLPPEYQPIEFTDITHRTETICSTLEKAYVFAQGEELKEVIAQAICMARHMHAALDRKVRNGNT